MIVLACVDANRAGIGCHVLAGAGGVDGTPVESRMARMGAGSMIIAVIRSWLAHLGHFNESMASTRASRVCQSLRCGGARLSAGAAMVVRRASTVRAGRPLSGVDGAVASLTFVWQHERSSCCCGTTCRRQLEALHSYADGSARADARRARNRSGRPRAGVRPFRFVRDAVGLDVPELA
jgi:hypothetical protein